ncbi:MAG: hypothetical protein OEO23_05225, partial [Gemmatimonadota bacterium]|nr:hypothetical protein [Gemmatimonadota bacterium]
EFVVNDRLMETIDSVVSVFFGSATAGVSKLKAESLCEELKRGARAWIQRLDSETEGLDTMER